MKTRSLKLTDSEAREFWSLVDVKGSDDCWLWQGGKNGDGYGYYKQRRANRLALSLAKGPIKHYALHTCGSENCCNPNHLYDGTHEQNMVDMQNDGTHDGKNRRSEDHPCALLSNDDVRAIRASPAKGRALAKQYGVSEATISSIRHYTRWSYLV